MKPSSRKRGKQRRSLPLLAPVPQEYEVQKEVAANKKQIEELVIQAPAPHMRKELPALHAPVPKAVPKPHFVPPVREEKKVVYEPPVKLLRQLQKDVLLRHKQHERERAEKLKLAAQEREAHARERLRQQEAHIQKLKDVLMKKREAVQGPISTMAAYRLRYEDEQLLRNEASNAARIRLLTDLIGKQDTLIHKKEREEHHAVALLKKSAPKPAEAEALTLKPPVKEKLPPAPLPPKKVTIPPEKLPPVPVPPKEIKVHVVKEQKVHLVRKIPPVPVSEEEIPQSAFPQTHPSLSVDSVHKVDQLIVRCYKTISQGQPELAEVYYQEIQPLFSQLTRAQELRVYPKVLDLYNRLTMQRLHRLTLGLQHHPRKGTRKRLHRHVKKIHVRHTKKHALHRPEKHAVHHKVHAKKKIRHGHEKKKR